MTSWLLSDSWKILAMCWDKHHQMSFWSKNFLFISMKHEIPAVVRFNESQPTNIQHRTDVLQITGPLESPAPSSYTQQDISWVEHAGWVWFMPLWLVAYYIFLRTFHFCLSSSPPFPQQEVMAPHTPQPGVIESESCQTTGASSNASLAETQQQCRHQLVHHDAAIAATENITQDAHFKRVCKTGHSNNRMRHAIGCE